MDQRSDCGYTSVLSRILDRNHSQPDLEIPGIEPRALYLQSMGSTTVCSQHYVFSFHNNMAC